MDTKDRQRDEDTQGLGENELFRVVFEHSPYPIVITRVRDATYLAVNPAFEHHSGYSAAEAVGKTVAELGLLRFGESGDRILELLRRDGRVENVVVETRTRDGTIRRVRHSSVLAEFRGEPCAISMVSDDTDRLYAEEALRQSENRFRTLIESAPVAIAIAREMTLVYVNPRFIEMFGYESAAELQGRSVYEFVEPGQLARFIERAQRFEAGLSADKAYEVVAVKKDRTVFQIAVAAARVALPDGPALVSFVQDVTEHRKAEEALRLQKRRLEAASNAARVALWAWDIPTGRLEWSDVVDRMLGYEPGEFARTVERWGELLHPDDRERTIKTLYQHLEQGTMYSAEYRVRKKDGSYVWWLDAGDCLRDSTGKVVEMFGACLDITRQKQSEERLRQAQKLEAVGTLAGGIAHDFNNILGAVLSYAELAREASGDRPEVMEYLDNVLRACDRAKDLVCRILYFSRQTQRERKPLSLATVVEEALKLLRASLPSTIEMRTRIASGLPQVLADPTQVHQIVMNLCANAAHALRGRIGHLEVGLERFPVDEAYAQTHSDLRPGLFVRLLVSDDGCGMDEETRKRIFEPFFTTKGPSEGTGLGLSVVHGIVKEHDGAIDVYSQPGKGTRFHIYFPAIVTEEELAPSAGAGLALGRQERVLVVDDEPVLCSALCRLLTRLGYQPTPATNPRQALAQFCADPSRFDLVITDLTMPGMTGVDLAMALIAVRPALPVLLTSGFSGTYTPEMVQEMGIVDLLPKPVSLRQLSEFVRRALR